VLAKVDECLDLDQQAVFVIRGGPGTGKSVLALNLMADLSAAGRHVHHATGSSAFTQTVRKIVGTPGGRAVQVLQQLPRRRAGHPRRAHLRRGAPHPPHSWNRFTKKRADDPDRPQIDELLTVAKVAVFFIDDHQAVRRDEIGRSDDILHLAKEHDAEVFEHELEVQFRCGGSDGFVRWLEHTLQIRPTANKLWTGTEGFDFHRGQPPGARPHHPRPRRRRHSARLVAGYCWPWSDPTDRGAAAGRRRDRRLGDAVERQPDAGRLAPGIPKSHLWAHDPDGLEQVGCIYTAQGFEFDHVGVIWGRDLVYRPRQGWVGRPEHSHDPA
jgi:uncharacterized protein